jgi:CheY-like chemotaxis protein/HAMP domain-containing protein
MGWKGRSLAARFAIASFSRIGLVLLVVLYVAFNTRSIIEANAELDHSHEMLQRSKTIAGLVDLLSFSVGTLVGTGDSDVLRLLNTQKERVVGELSALQHSLAERPEQLARVEGIGILIHKWWEESVAGGQLLKEPRAVGKGSPTQQGAKVPSAVTVATLKARLGQLEADAQARIDTQRKRVLEAAEKTRIAVIGGILLIVLVGLVFSLLAVQSITRRMNKLVRATRRLAEGDIEVTTNIQSDDEIGDLSRAFDQTVLRLNHVEAVAKATALADFTKQVQVLGPQDRLARAINQMSGSLQRLAGERQAQDWLKNGQAELHFKMRSEHDLIPLTQTITQYLATYTGAQVGAFYLAQGGRFKLVASYAYQHSIGKNCDFGLGEGLVGQAALEQKRFIVDRIQSDGWVPSIHNGLEEHQPQQLVLLPLVYEGEVEAVLVLGVSRVYTPIELEFLDAVALSVAISIHVTRTQSQLAELLEESKRQAEELQAQQEELRAANEELEEQAVMLTRSEETLRHKTDELQQMNAELEERTEELERQKAETEGQNRTIEQARQAVEAQAQDLARASQYKSEFLANMSHELRTPLNSLLILSQSLAGNRQGNLTEEQVEDARVIYQGGQALLGLINDILDLSKVEAGKLDIHMETVAVAGVLESLRSQFEPIARNKGVELRLEQDASLPEFVTTDPQRLEQVLRNLVSNGLKFTLRGAVCLRVRRPPSSVIFANESLQGRSVIAFEVQDTGIGIHPAQQQAVFEAFQQADGSISRTFGGTGLGLTISRELVSRLGGEIQLQSEPGKGSVFTLYIPFETEFERADQEGVVSTSPVEAHYLPEAPVDIGAICYPNDDVQPYQAAKVAVLADIEEGHDDDRHVLSAGKRSVLIIEDDPAFSRVLMGLARQKGYRCLVTSSGREGLVLAEQHQPNAIILDLGLPDIGGRQVLGLLKQNIRTRHIPVHVLSAEDRNNELMRLGAIGFLTKPASGEQIDTLFQRLEALQREMLKRVLLVEDDSHNRQAVIRLISSKQVEIVAVSTGEEARERLQCESFGCVILDLTLPDISGFELLNQLSRDATCELPPVVVYTGRELTQAEFRELNEYTSSIVIKGVSSPERLLDETTLFLHSVESSLPAGQRDIIQMLHRPEKVLEGRKVLLVDDDLRNTYALSKALRENGLEVCMADNGELALEKLSQDDGIELVLMDIMMPVMDGYESMRRIRKQPRYKKLPIIALTAKAMPDDRAASIEAGANDYCTKPVDVRRLVSMMRLWLFK